MSPSSCRHTIANAAKSTAINSDRNAYNCHRREIVIHSYQKTGPKPHRRRMASSLRPAALAAGEQKRKTKSFENLRGLKRYDTVPMDQFARLSPSLYKVGQRTRQLSHIIAQ